MKLSALKHGNELVSQIDHLEQRIKLIKEANEINYPGCSSNISLDYEREKTKALPAPLQLVTTAKLFKDTVIRILEQQQQQLRNELESL